MQEYRVKKFESHEKMEDGLNNAARDDWSPIHYAIQSGSGARIGWHYVIFARNAKATAPVQPPSAISS